MESRVVHDAEYRIVVRGELDSRFASLFNGMEMRCAAGKTVLEGEVIDQAQLYGYIERFEELGLELLSVEQTRQSHRTDERKGKT
jgi:hypothetical protein